MKIAPTNHDCTCGHLPAEHSGKYRRCEGVCHDSEYGQYACMCFTFVRDPDEGVEQ